MFAEAVVDFDEIEACANRGPELLGGQRAGGQSKPGRTHHRQYDGGIVVPKLMHDPHAGNDPEEEED